jgi:hypothetical protein
MNYAELICLAAKKAMGEEAELGVRLSPIELHPDEAPALADAALALMGGSVYVAISVPGLTPREEERLCLASGNRAAEQATRWRNTISPARGERILYVAAQRLDKEGGLQDTLYPVTEAHLRDAFMVWSESDESWLPVGFCQALKEAGVFERLATRDLCYYSEKFNSTASGRNDWRSAGEHLPLLGLAADSALSAQDALARLSGNWRMVQGAASGAEAARRTKNASEATKAVHQQLSAALTEVHATRAEQLQHIDLGQVVTEELPTSPKVARRAQDAKAPRAEARLPAGAAKPAAPRPQGAQAKPLPSGAPEAKRGAAPEPSSSVIFTPAAVPTRAHNEDDAGLLEDTDDSWPTPADEDFEDALLTPTAPPVIAPAIISPPTPAPPKELPKEPPKAARRGPPDWLVESYERELGELDKAPVGTREAIKALVEGDGEGLHVYLQQGALRQHLQKALRYTRAPVALSWAPPFGDDLEQAISAWQKARRALVVPLLEARGRSSVSALDRLVQAPMLLFAYEDLQDLARELLERASAMFDAAAMDPYISRETRARLLAVETAWLETDDSQALLVGPLHPLILGQTLARLEAMKASSKLPSNLKRALVRALAQTPVAPRAWPLPNGQALWLSQGGRSLLYESSPAEISDDDMRNLAGRLLKAYLALHPHAYLGVSALIHGQGASSFIEGLAEALAQEPRCERVDVHLSAPLDRPPEKTTRKQVDEERLHLKPAPANERDLRPHLIVHLNPPKEPHEERPYADQALAQSTGGVGALQTRFDLVKEGLLVRTPVKGVRGVEECERLWALVSGKAPTGTFIHADEATRLAAVFPSPPAQSIAWQVAVGTRISRRARAQASLLMYDAVGAAGKVAVLTRSMAPLARSLEASFKLLGVADTRPSTLRALAQDLSKLGNRGLCSLYSKSEQLVAAELLGLWIRTRHPQHPALVAHIVDTNYATLLGADQEEHPWGAFALGVYAIKNKLKLYLGYAALQEALPMRLDQGKAIGPLAERLERLAELLQAATRGGDELGPSSAREALGWLLWPALATENERLFEPIRRALDALPSGISVSLEAVCLLPRGHSMIAGKVEATFKGDPLHLVGLDGEIFEHLVAEAQGLDIYDPNFL